MTLNEALHELIEHYAELETEARDDGDDEAAAQARRRRMTLSRWISWRTRERNEREDAARQRQRQSRR